MVKHTRLKALQELKEDFKINGRSSSWRGIYNLLDNDYIVNAMDVYEVDASICSRSIINGWTSHTDNNKYYSFYVEMIKAVNDKVATEWVKIELNDADLLIKLYDVLEAKKQ